MRVKSNTFRVVLKHRNLPYCISRRAPKIESFSASSESSEHCGLHLPVLPKFASKEPIESQKILELEVLRRITTTLRPWPDVIEGRALLLPDRRMWNIEPSARHRLAAEGAAAFLLGPQVVEDAQAPSSFGTVHPRRAHAARTVLRSRQATVISPTPPGTGVIQLAVVRHSSK